MTQVSRKEKLIHDISQIDERIRQASRTHVSQLVSLTSSAAHIYRLMQHRNKLVQEHGVLDTDTLYIHIMTDHEKHRVFRIMKGSRPSHHSDLPNHLQFFFTDSGNIRVEAGKIRMPLYIETPLRFDTHEHAYTVTVFFTRSEANRSLRENARPSR